MSTGTAGAATLNAYYNDSDYSAAINNPTVTVDGDLAFRIEFDDSLGIQPGILEGSEFQSFVWVNDPFFATRNVLRVVPSTPVSAYFRPDGAEPTPETNVWVFAPSAASATFSSFATTFFTYEIVSGTAPDPDPSVIPLPPAAALMFAGLGGLAVMGRRRRAA